MSGSPIIQDGKLVGEVTHVILLCGAKSGTTEGGVKIMQNAEFIMQN